MEAFVCHGRRRGSRTLRFTLPIGTRFSGDQVWPSTNNLGSSLRNSCERLSVNQPLDLKMCSLEKDQMRKPERDEGGSCEPSRLAPSHGRLKPLRLVLA